MIEELIPDAGEVTELTENALIFGGYTAVALIVCTVLLDGRGNCPGAWATGPRASPTGRQPPVRLQPA